MSEKKGKISQIIGPVVDVTFKEGGDALPKIYDSLEIKKESGEKVVVECQQHIGENSLPPIATHISSNICSLVVSFLSSGKYQAAPKDLPLGTIVTLINGAACSNSQLTVACPASW